MKTIKKRIKRNAPTLMIIGNVIGVFVTGGLCVYETIKAVRKVDKLKETVEKPTKKQILKAVAPYYISPAISAGLTVGLGLSSNAVNIKRQQALSAALIASNEAFRAFKEKTVEKIGEEGVKKIVEKQAKEATTQEPKKISQNADYITVYDKFSGYKFRTTQKDLDKAEFEVNRRLNHSENGRWVGEVNYDDFFRWMNVKPTLYSKAYCWDSSNMWDSLDTGWVDFYHEKTTDVNGDEIIILRYSVDPIAKRVVNNI